MTPEKAPTTPLLVMLLVFGLSAPGWAVGGDTGAPHPWQNLLPAVLERPHEAQVSSCAIL